MRVIYPFLSFIAIVVGAVTDNYKDQFCTDPRTMQKHPAYSEWPDSYSCTRHRCQPGGRNLAIYTVGCKRVEAPESAIECEEVVEDTNMQFPYCCTRLRCLVVVRGEVWTRVLGQPWETLPAAPWSHMYKMKKPPPGDNAFVNKNVEVKGPIYELQSENNNEHDKMLRASKKSSSTTDCIEPVARAGHQPDIVIALATPNDEKKLKNDNSRRKKTKSSSEPNDENEEKEEVEHFDVDLDDGTGNDKASWTEIPQSQWNVHDPAMEVESSSVLAPMEKNEKPSGLQALVDAIGNRMRDIETVVQKMSEKVQKPENEFSSIERKSDGETLGKHQASDDKVHAREHVEKEKKRPNPDNDHYQRFSARNRGSKYLRTNDATSEQPVFIDDTNLNGYFSDASNSVMRRNLPKEPGAAPTYVAPVENRRKIHDVSEEGDKKHKKHTHKKKRKGKGHKKHHNKEEKVKKHLNILQSAELDKNVISLEDSGANF